ncbi:MAG: hypothetical protein AB8B59_17010 [Maribacter sp.]
MKLKTQILLLVILCHLQLCKAQKSQLTTGLPKVENQLVGELDYTIEALDLVQSQANGEEISLGKIQTDGTIHFNLPEFDSIPLILNKFQNWFSIDSDCKDRDVFAETPFDDVSSYKYDPIFIKKYGMNIAALYPVSDEKIVSRKNNQRAILPAEAKYFWFYIDRDITYKDDCIKISNRTGDAYAKIRANIKFEKGWNFIEENLVYVQEVVQADSQTTTVRTTEFKRSLPASKKVKWIIKQFREDEEIQAFKKLYNLTPISKVQFETWAPNKLGDLALTTKEYGNPPKGRKNKNNIHLIYANESQKKEINLYVVDYSKNPGDLEMIDFAYAMENDGKDEKDIKPYVAQYSEREKVTKLFYKFGDRMFVEASATNINAEDLWGYIKKMKVEKLL